MYQPGAASGFAPGAKPDRRALWQRGDHLRVIDRRIDGQ